MVEIMMAMGILLLMLTLTVTYYGDMQADAQRDAAKAELDAIKGDIHRYQLEKRCDYPLRTPPAAQSQEGPERTDPWGVAYRVDPDRHVIWSCGPNGRDENGAGDDVVMTYEDFGADALKPPSGVHVSSFGPGWAEISWNRVKYKSGVAGYNVYRRESVSASAFTTVPQNAVVIPDSDSPHWHDEGLAVGLVYYYSVEVVTADGARLPARTPLGFQIPIAGPPQVSVTPANVSAAVGQTVSFAITASGVGSAIKSITFDSTIFEVNDGTRTVMATRTFNTPGPSTLTATAVDAAGRAARYDVPVQVH